jgi:hypothetical protein
MSETDNIKSIEKIKCTWTNTKTGITFTEEFYKKEVGRPAIYFYSYDKKNWFDKWEWDKYKINLG